MTTSTHDSPPDRLPLRRSRRRAPARQPGLRIWLPQTSPAHLFVFPARMSTPACGAADPLHTPIRGHLLPLTAKGVFPPAANAITLPSNALMVDRRPAALGCATRSACPRRGRRSSSPTAAPTSCRPILGRHSVDGVRLEAVEPRSARGRIVDRPRRVPEGDGAAHAPRRRHRDPAGARDITSSSIRCSKTPSP